MTIKNPPPNLVLRFWSTERRGREVATVNQGVGIGPASAAVVLVTILGLRGLGFRALGIVVQVKGNL